MGATGAQKLIRADESAYRILIALNDSLESRAALGWAIENLICEEDWVLLYHMVKTPALIPTAMGMVPFVGASPAMQRAHIQVAIQDGKNLLGRFQAYCSTKGVNVKTEVGRCKDRAEDLLKRVKAEDVTHLVMGTTTASKFSIRLGKKPSLTSRIREAADCQLILIDKKKRPTFHSKIAHIQMGESPHSPYNRRKSETLPEKRSTSLNFSASPSPRRRYSMDIPLQWIPMDKSPVQRELPDAESVRKPDVEGLSRNLFSDLPESPSSHSEIVRAGGEDPRDAVNVKHMSSPASPDSFGPAVSAFSLPLSHVGSYVDKHVSTFADTHLSTFTDNHVAPYADSNVDPYSDNHVPSFADRLVGSHVPLDRSISQDSDLFSIPEMDEADDATTVSEEQGRPLVAGLFYSSPARRFGEPVRVHPVNPSKEEPPPPAELVAGNQAPGGSPGVVDQGVNQEMEEWLNAGPRRRTLPTRFSNLTVQIEDAASSGSPPVSLNRKPSPDPRTPPAKAKPLSVCLTKPHYESPTSVGDFPESPANRVANPPGLSKPPLANSAAARRVRKPEAEPPKSPETPIRSPVDLKTIKEKDALIQILREQVNLLRALNEVKDREIDTVTKRAELAEKAAQDLQKAILSEKRMREKAEIKGSRLATELAALQGIQIMQSTYLQDAHIQLIVTSTIVTGPVFWFSEALVRGG